MRQILLKAWNVWKGRKKYPKFKTMPSWLLSTLGGTSAIIAGYWGIAFAAVAPEYCCTVNKYGFKTMGILLGILILMMAFAALWYGAIARRCGEILYKRYFK